MYYILTDMVDNNANKVVNDVKKVLRGFDGLTITDLVNQTKLSRSAIRTALAKLEGGKNVSIKKIGMAKVYSLNKRRSK